MRLAGTQSWQVRWGDEHAANLALYVRDALALSVTTDPDIPLLFPSVPVFVPPGMDRGAITREWPGWWTDVLTFAAAEHTGSPHERYAEYPVQPRSSALVDRPAVRAAVEAFTPISAPHFSARKQELMGAGGVTRDHGVGDLVRARETELGRPAKPFRLTVTELPVAGLVWHRLTDEHVLVSTEFAADPTRCVPALRAVITELA